MYIRVRREVLHNKYHATFRNYYFYLNLILYIQKYTNKNLESVKYIITIKFLWRIISFFVWQSFLVFGTIIDMQFGLGFDLIVQIVFEIE